MSQGLELGTQFFRNIFLPGLHTTLNALLKTGKRSGYGIWRFLFFNTFLSTFQIFEMFTSDPLNYKC